MVNGIQAALSGRLTADPEQRYTQTGKALLQLALVVDEQRRGPDTSPTYVRATLWEEMAEQMAPALERGSLVYLEGRLTLNKWRGQDGAERSGLNLSATRCDVVGAVGRQPSTRPALGQHQARPVQRPTAGRPPDIHRTASGRPVDDEPPIESYGEPGPDEMSFDERAGHVQRTPLPIRQRIAQAAGEGQQRAAERRPWRR